MVDKMKESYSFAVLTMSDKGSRGEREDTSGPYLKKKLAEEGFVLRSYTIVPDQKQEIIAHLKQFADDLKVDLIVTTGGTGVSPSDVTPEAMNEVLDREIPGMAEAMRSASLLKTPRAMLSRGKVGIRGKSLIVNFPGSLKAVKENLEVILPVLSHALEKIGGETSDCGISTE
ncbi:MAG: MogA/MoaB family molybdenum cofactor biosynthesis protein [Desulforhopalus sp.]|nr:MogA/MoaB family molybdenum cofactor biosynthesis protein [Desulforhopalus sp.]